MYISLMPVYVHSNNSLLLSMIIVTEGIKSPKEINTQCINLFSSAFHLIFNNRSPSNLKDEVSFGFDKLSIITGAL